MAERSPLTVGDWTINPETKVATHPSGHTKKLTPAELTLLELIGEEPRSMREVMREYQETQFGDVYGTPNRIPRWAGEINEKLTVGDSLPPVSVQDGMVKRNF